MIKDVTQIKPTALLKPSSGNLSLGLAPRAATHVAHIAKLMMQLLSS